MDIESLVRESRAEQLLGGLGFSTEAGQATFKRQIRQFSSDIPTLQRRQAVCLQLRAYLKENPEASGQLRGLFAELGAVEKEADFVQHRTTVESDSFEQILFSHYESLRILNTMPFLLLAVALYKQFVIPALAILSPLLIVIGPYLALRYWYKTPISASQYTRIMMDKMGLHSDMNLKQVAQMGLTAFTFLQSIYQPVQNAIHISKIDKDIVQKGGTVQKIAVLYAQIRNLLPEHLRPKHPLMEALQGASDSRTHFALAWDQPFLMKYTWSCIGECEVLFRLAESPLQAPRFVSAVAATAARASPCLILRGATDPFLSAAEPFSLHFHGKQHALLTGPNRGGKSSTLRTTLLAVLLAQTVGVSCFQDRMILRPFHWMATGLRLEDRPGTASMFESEVEFAHKIIRRAAMRPSQTGLVLFDELFHSTNPPDGKRTAEIFLQQLWRCPNVASFISTHVFALVEAAPTTIQRLCTYAFRDETGDLHLTYRLQPGLCTESTVDAILEEKGLLKRLAAKCGNDVPGKPLLQQETP